MTYKISKRLKIRKMIELGKKKTEEEETKPQLRKDLLKNSRRKKTRKCKTHEV